MIRRTRHLIVSASFPFSCRGQHWSINGFSFLLFFFFSFCLFRTKGRVISFHALFSSHDMLPSWRVPPKSLFETLFQMGDFILGRERLTKDSYVS